MAKIIGEGWQYRVYDHGVHVEKHPKSLEDIKRRIRRHPAYWVRPGEVERRARQVIERRERSIERLQENSIDPAILAHPRIDDGVIVQDRVEPVGNQIRHCLEWQDYEKIRDILDAYINTVLTCWQYGFADHTYSFTTNYGINGAGDVVLIDLGELTFSKHAVAQHITENRWTQQWSYRWHIWWLCGPQFLHRAPWIRRYFRTRMNNTLTHDRLDREWKQRRP